MMQTYADYLDGPEDWREGDTFQEGRVLMWSNSNYQFGLD